MKHHLRIVAYILFLALLGTGLTQNECTLQGVPASTAGEDAVWLKINELLVFYLNPVAPHLIEGALMLPAEPIAHLLGLRYDFAEAAHEATFSLAGQQLALKAGAHEARINGATVPVPVPARLLDGARDLLVPLRLIIQAFKLSSDWNATGRVLSIQSSTALTDRNISRVFLRRVPSVPRLDITPTAFSFTPGEDSIEGHCASLLFQVTLEPDAASGHTPSLYAMFQYDESFSIAGPFVYISDDPANTSQEPCYSNGDIVICQAAIQWNPVRYILGVFVER